METLDTLITQLRQARRAHLDARHAKAVTLARLTTNLHDKGLTWTAAERAALNCPEGLAVDRRAAEAGHDCEEINYRIRYGLAQVGAVVPPASADVES